MRFDPRPGIGGHCLPIDPMYLSWAAHNQGRGSQLSTSSLRSTKPALHMWSHPSNSISSSDRRCTAGSSVSSREYPGRN
ncbi:hypothetical protein ACFXG4_42870 [Nocardia sp. NPDC059246]|uniref:hypothetical protein n=1 Tax=unclassified Nocardia TaxID=2637762 RepID=UPI0036C6C711